MEITRENIDALNGVIRIKIAKEDYQDIVEKALKTLRNRVSMPGFRPGKVPAGMVQKMYGKQVLSDEIGKLTVDKLFAYIEEQKIQYLGEPLPSATQTPIDWDKDTSFEFSYDIGFMPDVDPVLPSGGEFIHYRVQPSQESVEQEIEKLTKEYGNAVDVDTVEADDFVFGELVYTTPEGEEKRNAGIYLPMARIDSEEGKAALLGKASGDTVTLPLTNLFAEARATSIYLSLGSEDEIAQLPETAQLFISKISRRMPATLDQAFFDEVFGEGNIQDETQFREAIGRYVVSNVQNESNMMLMTELREKIRQMNPLDIPEAFLKRWLLISNRDNKNFDPNEVEANWDSYKDSFTWEILRSKLAQKMEVEVSAETLREEAREMMRRRMLEVGYALPEDRLDAVTDRFLSNRAEADRLYMSILEARTVDKVRQQIGVTEQDIPMEEFKQIKEARETAEA